MQKHKILLLVLLLLACIFAGILLGSVPLHPASVLRCLAGLDKDSTTYILVNTVRLPRVMGQSLPAWDLPQPAYSCRVS